MESGFLVEPFSQKILLGVWWNCGFEFERLESGFLEKLILCEKFDRCVVGFKKADLSCFRR